MKKGIVAFILFALLATPAHAQPSYMDSESGHKFRLCVVNSIGEPRLKNESLLAKDLTDEGFKSCQSHIDAFIDGIHNDPQLSVQDKAVFLNKFLETVRAMKIALTETILQVRIDTGPHS